MKYIVMEVDGEEVIFTFPRIIDHDRMLEGIQSVRFGSEQDWQRCMRRQKPISAGFVDGGVCNGRSETLRLDSRGAADTDLLKERAMTSEDRITELWNAHCTYDDLGAPSRKDVLEFAEAIRREAMEGAAQMFEALGKGLAASQIRALKEQP